jgi:hypothetical protein
MTAIEHGRSPAQVGQPSSPVYPHGPHCPVQHAVQTPKSPCPNLKRGLPTCIGVSEIPVFRPIHVPPNDAFLASLCRRVSDSNTPPGALDVTCFCNNPLASTNTGHALTCHFPNLLCVLQLHHDKLMETVHLTPLHRSPNLCMPHYTPPIHSCRLANPWSLHLTSRDRPCTIQPTLHPLSSIPIMLGSAVLLGSQ